MSVAAWEKFHTGNNVFAFIHIFLLINILAYIYISLGIAGLARINLSGLHFVMFLYDFIKLK